MYIRRQVCTLKNIPTVCSVHQTHLLHKLTLFNTRFMYYLKRFIRRLISSLIILQSRKNKTLFTPSCELECQYITFDIFYIGLKSAFEVKECIMIYILSALKQFKKNFNLMFYHIAFFLLLFWYAYDIT